MDRPKAEKVYVTAPTYHLFKTYCRRHDISDDHAIMFVHITRIYQLRGLQNITLHFVGGFPANSDLGIEALTSEFLRYPNNNVIKRVDM